MTDRAARLVCVALVVAAVLGGVGAAAPSASAQTTETIAGSQIAPDDVSMRIELRSDGSAAWAVEYRVRLDDENTTDAFESLRSDIRANESQYTAQFGDRMASTAATAENATGREMAIRNVSVTATRQQLPQDYGVVRYTFVWTNFAAVEDGQIRAGDALAGLFLDEETSLQFAWPEGYALDTVQPAPDDTRSSSRIVVWNGPLDFGPNEPTLVATEVPAGGDETATRGHRRLGTASESQRAGRVRDWPALSWDRSQGARRPARAGSAFVGCTARNRRLAIAVGSRGRGCESTRLGAPRISRASLARVSCLRCDPVDRHDDQTEGPVSQRTSDGARVRRATAADDGPVEMRCL